MHCRMVATASGIDARLMQAAQALLAVGRGTADGQPISLRDFLRHRCQQLLAGYPTSVEEDEELLQRLESSREESSAASSGNGDTAAARQQLRPQQWATAVRYRLGKKRVLLATVAGLEQ